VNAVNEKRRKRAERLLQLSAASVCGQGASEALGGIPVERYLDDPVCGRAARLLAAASAGRFADSEAGGGGSDSEAGGGSPDGALQALFQEAVRTFTGYYGREERAERVEQLLELFDSGVDRGLLAEEIVKVWAPELLMDDEEILERWQLRELTAAPHPIRPEQVLLQLNALYTLPEEIPSELEAGLAGLGEAAAREPGRKVADYDHPVPLFAPDEEHELVGCMDELEREVAFEKECGVLPEEHRVPVLISVSVTHEALDRPAGTWIRRLLGRREYRHLLPLVLTEEAAAELNRAVFESGGGSTEGSGKLEQERLFSVFGAYGRHFTALKYAQLLLEPVLGVKAGFKLDTDEGIRSRELHAATGRSWFATLAHPYWGGRARDRQGRVVNLGVNEGEYVNSSDIERLGFAEALRTPDVAVPDSWSGPAMFFHKGFAHGRATALYNRFHAVEEGISHPVVKGGGYGITNEALRKAAPFTFSRVGRAEDQQFYFSCLAEGVRGIFHPDLRIAHYKSAVGRAEEKTAASRFAGDLYRLIIFEHLVRRYGVKDELDPMPGIFAGPLARAQACFALLLGACGFRQRGEDGAARYLLSEGAERLAELERQIDDGTVDREFEQERDGWRAFVEQASRVPPQRVAEIFGLDRSRVDR
jgi:hypothetical protein